jgi:hypothetical protein
VIPIYYLAQQVEALFESSEHLPAWRAFVSEAEIEGWFDNLDDHDGRIVVMALLDDLGGLPDGSAFLRWRAEGIRAGKRTFTGGVRPHDAVLVALALETIATPMSKASPHGIDD